MHTNYLVQCGYHCEVNHLPTLNEKLFPASKIAEEFVCDSTKMSSINGALAPDH